MKLEYTDLGNFAYQQAWDYQQKRMDELIEMRKNPDYQSTDFAGWFLAVEHPHVYTLGKSGDEQNLLLDFIQLQAKNAEFIHTNRGGDITYHGPGQFVGYPIIDLDKLKISVRRYIELMEEAIIKTMAQYGIVAERLEGATGVWVDSLVPGKARKICAIGVRVSRYVTMHGFALNINTDLSYFGHINPCGFTDKAVTSMEKELGAAQDAEKVKQLVFAEFVKLINLQ
ncbi:MAG: lipoate--protein ligase [Bacteroidetes bacterium HGW-Bacteroidetes-6]|jgi:lipoyl(octanoyl) transferase|nr:MAG: lipoate--protein ligase [Bacteroidetes bacterium HGW-Bacteroidetes-6]